MEFPFAERLPAPQRFGRLLDKKRRPSGRRRSGIREDPARARTERVGWAPPDAMLERFVLRREETNLGIPARTAAYLYDVLRFGIGRDFPERMLAASDSMQRLRLFPDMTSIPVPVKLVGALFTGESEAVGAAMCPRCSIWDFEQTYAASHGARDNYSDPIRFELGAFLS